MNTENPDFQPWNGPLKVRRMINHGAHALDGSGWQWEVTDRHGERIAERLLRGEAEAIVRACNSFGAAVAARDFLRDRFGHAEAQHDPQALHALAELDRALVAK